MKHTLKSLRTLAATLITFGSLAGGAKAAISITINRITGGINASGTYVLLDATSSNISNSYYLPNASGGWGYVTDGAGTAFTPRVSGRSSYTSLFFPSNNISWSIFDASNSNAVLDSGTFASFGFSPNSSFISFNGGTSSGARDAAVDAGDIFSLSGNFTLEPVELAKLSSFSDGVHVSTYNNDQLTLTFTSVPEPSSVLLFGLGSLGLVARRRRIK